MRTRSTSASATLVVLAVLLLGIPATVAEQGRITLDGFLMDRKAIDAIDDALGVRGVVSRFQDLARNHPRAEMLETEAVKSGYCLLAVRTSEMSEAEKASYDKGDALAGRSVFEARWGDSNVVSGHCIYLDKNGNKLARDLLTKSPKNAGISVIVRGSQGEKGFKVESIEETK